MTSFFRTLLGLSLLVSAPAYCDVEYYTYGGFDPIVNAFSMIAAVFNSSDYIYFGFVVAIVGISIGTLIKSGLSALGKATGFDALAVLILGLFGTALYTATFAPKTTVHIYDPTVNRYQSVGDIPYALAFIASGTNLLERGLTDIVSGSTVFGRDRHANGRSLELLFNLLNSDPIPDNIYLSMSMEEFVNVCIVSAAASPDTHEQFNYNSILNGTADIWEELQKARNPNQYILWYDEANPKGVSTTCTQAYDSLYAALTDVGTFDSFVRTVCLKSGFDGSADDSLQDCKNLIEDTVPLVYSASVTATAENMTAMSALSHALYDTLAKDPGTAIAYIGNVKQLSQGFGSALVAEGWLPAMRSGTLVIILSFTPIMVLLVLTPFVFRALHMITVLFLFLTIWGASDAVVHSTIVQNVLMMFSDLKAFDGGLRGFMLAPTELQKAIAQFGKMQSLGVMFAGIVCAVYFKFSYYQFANMGEKLANDIDQTGQTTGSEVINPTARMQTMIENESAAGKYNAMDKVGHNLYGAGVQYTSTNYDWANAHSIDKLKQDHPKMSQTDLMDASAQLRGGMDAGQINARMQRADESGGTVRDVSTGLGNTQQLGSDASLVYNQSQADRLAGSAVQKFDDLSKITNTTAGKINASDRPLDHERVAETETAIGIGRSDAFDQVYGSPAAISHHSENATHNQIEDANALRAARLEEVEKGNARSSQAVANETIAFSTQTALGSADASKQYVNEGRIEDTRDGAKEAGINSLRSSLATNRAMDDLGRKTNADDDSIAQSTTQYGLETTVGASEARENLTRLLDKDSLQVSKQQNAGVRIITDDGDVHRINEYSPGSLSAAAGRGAASFGILEEDDGNMHISNPEMVVGGKTTFQGNTNSYSGVERILESTSTSDVLNLIESADTPTQQQNLALALANGLVVNRTASESEGSEFNMGGGAEIYARTPVAEISPTGILGKAAKLAGLGGGKKGASTPPHSSSSSDAARMKTSDTLLITNSGGRKEEGMLDKAANMIPAISIGGTGRVNAGGKFSDNSLDQASVNSNQAMILEELQKAKEAISATDDQDVKLDAALQFQEFYNGQINEDSRHSNEIAKDTDTEMIEDKYNTDVEQIYQDVMEEAGLSDVSVKDVFQR